MRIDITEIAGIDGACIKVKKDIPASEIAAGKGDVELVESIHVDLKIEYMEGMIVVSGTVSGKHHAVCGRCLKDIDEGFVSDIDENFRHASDTEEENNDYEYEGGYIDLSVPIIDNIFLGFPSNMLCSEDCKGLCSICGKDLNEGDCECDRSDHDINIKMEKLKDFFEK